MEPSQHSRLTVLLAILVSALIFSGLGYWLGTSRLSTGTDDTTTTALPTDSLETFTSSTVSLTFKYPVDSSYSEETEPGNTGSVLFYKDATTQMPDFNAVTSDYKTNDSLFNLDMLPGTTVLSSTTNLLTELRIAITNQSDIQFKKIRPGMYLVASYTGYEGASSSPIYLLVEPPQNSGLKYISFYLGDNVSAITDDDLTPKDDIGTPQEVTAAGIERILALGLDEELPLIKDKLAKAITLAETFSDAATDATTDQTTYKNEDLGFTFSYPKTWINTASSTSECAAGATVFGTTVLCPLSGTLSPQAYIDAQTQKYGNVVSQLVYYDVVQKSDKSLNALYQQFQNEYASEAEFTPDPSSLITYNGLNGFFINQISASYSDNIFVIQLASGTYIRFINRESNTHYTPGGTSVDDQNNYTQYTETFYQIVNSLHSTE